MKRLKLLLCKIRHAWVSELNFKYRRWDPDPRTNFYSGTQNRYLRTCERCGKEQVYCRDVWGNTWWVAPPNEPPMCYELKPVVRG